jgi:hypothetical protein
MPAARLNSSLEVISFSIIDAKITKNINIPRKRKSSGRGISFRNRHHHKEQVIHQRG